ncbi:hypothetical protein Bhyg_08191 [Pseudolycoriella hygida]|uniref:Uncharacterized protein n=1 Tax=Pseudolycoriella hygida TaxID=35572 RepID=A0A9Q0N443_9DIPT|nr:hypothetical protein Bhyg_08191 [Pseudolycoriella hygida]
MRQAATIVDNKSSLGTRSNLVNNAQPISITGAPGFDSNGQHGEHLTSASVSAKSDYDSHTPFLPFLESSNFIFATLK